MHYQFPIEQLASSLQTRFQTGFARMATYLLPELEDVVYEATPQGLRILAGDECALAAPAEILRQVYGEQLRLGAPRVRFVCEAGAMCEPVMNLRVSVPAAADGPVVDDLRAREAVVQEIDRQRSRTIVRAQAPLRRLLGYHQSLGTLANNTAEAWTWLSHYAPVPDGPDGGTAA
jgi:predicted membrane GTPase involved in stress response